MAFGKPQTADHFCTAGVGGTAIKEFPTRKNTRISAQKNEENFLIFWKKFGRFLPLSSTAIASKTGLAISPPIFANSGVTGLLVTDNWSEFPQKSIETIAGVGEMDGGEEGDGQIWFDSFSSTDGTTKQKFKKSQKFPQTSREIVFESIQEGSKYAYYLHLTAKSHIGEARESVIGVVTRFFRFLRSTFGAENLAGRFFTRDD